MFKACRASNIRQSDVFRKPWPFVKVMLQQRNEIEYAKLLELQEKEKMEEKERKRMAQLKKQEEEEAQKKGIKSTKKTKVIQQKEKKEKKKKKPNKSKDVCWPTIHTWESYECDNTTSPEWADTFEIRLNQVAIGMPYIVPQTEEEKGEGKEEGKNGEEKEEEKTTFEQKNEVKNNEVKNNEGKNNEGENKDTDNDSPANLNTAGHVDTNTRLYIQVMDRDKDNAVKLGVLDIIDLHNVPVLLGDLPTEEEIMNKTKKKSKSEKDYEITYKKERAGDLYLDIRLKPSESMVAAGNMLNELFKVAEGLISSPLQSRWQSSVFVNNVNKVRSILSSVEACLKHWMFASLLSKMSNGGVSQPQLEEAKNGLIKLEAGLKERILFESMELERLEEEEHQNQIKQQEIDKRKREGMCR